MAQCVPARGVRDSLFLPTRMRSEVRAAVSSFDKTPDLACMALDSYWLKTDVGLTSSGRPILDAMAELAEAMFDMFRSDGHRWRHGLWDAIRVAHEVRRACTTHKVVCRAACTFVEASLVILKAATVYEFRAFTECLDDDLLQYFGALDLTGLRDMRYKRADDDGAFEFGIGGCTCTRICVCTTTVIMQ